MIVFGPVPSRRLGRSLGINTIPPKHCSYSCVYCQLGKTQGSSVRRRTWYEPGELEQEVRNRVHILRDRGEQIDYLTFLPDGEPTLDLCLGDAIDRIRDVGIPIAVMTNSSLLDDPTVRNHLARADLVSLKIDAVDTPVWERVNRPHPELSLKRILSGIRQFCGMFTGTLLTETMLVQGVNDHEEQIEHIAEFLSALQPTRAYISIPTRPPAEPWVVPPSESQVVKAYNLFQQAGVNCECLIGEEDTQFSRAGDVKTELLAITAVHPMREDAVLQFLRDANAGREVLQQLMKEGKLTEIPYRGVRYYLKKF
jgi:wyosine [tRNA(Phe)-imidazoG37] synthetase (radical SAM superfamily)